MSIPTNSPLTPPTVGDSDSKIWNDIIFFVLGAVVSAVIAIVVYFKQRKDDEKFQRELVIFLYTIWKQGGANNQVAARIEAKVDEVLKVAARGDELKALHNEFSRLDSKLRKEFSSPRQEHYVEDALAYKMVADAWSERAASKLTFKTLNKDGSTSLSRIRRVHKELFPEGYAWAGKTRKEEVAIIRMESVAARSIRPLLSTVATEVVEPAQVIPQLEKLIDRWNLDLGNTKNDNIDAQCEELAHFHHEFSLIHPFLDGNGRVARLISDEQASFLVKKKIKLGLGGNAYYQALRSADQGELGQLKNLIKEAIERHA